jgi:hypothetical protein
VHGVPGHVGLRPGILSLDPSALLVQAEQVDELLEQVVPGLALFGQALAGMASLPYMSRWRAGFSRANRTYSSPSRRVRSTVEFGAPAFARASRRVAPQVLRTRVEGVPTAIRARRSCR